MFRFLLENKKQNNQEYVCTYIVSFSILKISVNYVKKKIFSLLQILKKVFMLYWTPPLPPAMKPLLTFRIYFINDYKKIARLTEFFLLHVL